MLLGVMVIFIILLDQISKYISIKYLTQYNTIPIIQDVLHFTYVENRGASFGILQNQRWFLITTTIIVSCMIIYYLIILSNGNIYFRLSLSLILAGAIGNLIDRIRVGYVIDFIDFRLISFPVFNIADCSVVAGTIILAGLLLIKKDLKLL